jgi:predicted Na+-dependent transporter
LETNGPLGVLWTGLGLSAFYVALIWINTLLGVFLTPLFLIPLTRFMRGRRRAATEQE